MKTSNARFEAPRAPWRRQQGTPNKKAAYVRAVMAAHAAQDNVSPLDLILAAMREPPVALGQRVKVALRRTVLSSLLLSVPD